MARKEKTFKRAATRFVDRHAYYMRYVHEHGHSPTVEAVRELMDRMYKRGLKDGWKDIDSQRGLGGAKK